MTVPSSARPAADVVDAFDHELDEIESIFGTCVGHRTVAGFMVPYTPTEDGCLVAMWDAWNRFLRALVMNAASGPTMGLSGTTYSPATVRSEAQAVAHLHASRRGKAYSLIEGEPKWFDAKQLVDVMSTLQLDNSQTQNIISAIGATTISLGPVVVTNPIEEIRVCRNFTAHKAASTWSRVASYSSGTLTSLSAHLRQRMTGVETFSLWRECLSAVASSAAQ